MRMTRRLAVLVAVPMFALVGCQGNVPGFLPVCTLTVGPVENATYTFGPVSIVCEDGPITAPPTP